MRIAVLSIILFMLWSCNSNNARKIIDNNIKITCTDINIYQDSKIKFPYTLLMDLKNKVYSKLDSSKKYQTRNFSLSEKEIKQIDSAYYANKLSELSKLSVLNKKFKIDSDTISKMILEIQTNLGIQKIIIYPKMKFDDITGDQSLIEKVIKTKSTIKEERINNFISMIQHIIDKKIFYYN